MNYRTALRMLAKLKTLDVTWRPMIDGTPATLNELDVTVAAPMTSFYVDLTPRGETTPMVIQADYAVLGLTDDSILINGEEVDADDVDLQVKIGFPTFFLVVAFEYTDATGPHRVTLTGKVGLLGLIF